MDLHAPASRYQNQVAVITGASRGIGLAIAQRLVGEGARVCITARKPEPLAEAVAALGGPETALAVAGKEALDAALQRWGQIDLLVNNAGINPIAGPLLDADPDAIRKIFNVNLLGTLGWIRAAMSAWFSEHGGSVVNVASVAGLRPATDIGAYGASKAALAHATTQLAMELAPMVRVNGVLPGIVKTAFATPLFDGREAEVTARYPLGRLGAVEDVAAAVAYLGSSDASWVTGQLLIVDGGLTLGGGV
jgi:3-oxoacyl-[acyl-carrier protein] reductase